MKLRTLGTSEILISAIGLGCWQFSKGKGLAGGYWPALPDDEINRIVSTSLEGGVNWFDTAEMYGRGASERALSAALSRNGVAPGQVVVATKWMPILRFASSITGTIDERTAALSPFGIDLYQIHHPFSLSSIQSQMRGMAELVSRGIVRSVGVSNFSAGQMRDAHRELKSHGIALASNQVRFSLLDRDIEDSGVLDTARELGITIIAYSPLAQGLLTGKFHRNAELARNVPGPRRMLRRFRRLERTLPLIEALERIAQAHDATAAQIALSWVIHAHGDTVVAIPGASKVSQAESNTRAIDLVLDDAEYVELGAIARQLEI